MIARIFGTVRLTGWLSLLAGFTWGAFSIKALHELPRNMKAYGVELMHGVPHEELDRQDAYKLIATTCDEMTGKLPSIEVPIGLMLGGGVLVGVIPRRKK